MESQIAPRVVLEATSKPVRSPVDSCNDARSSTTTTCRHLIPRRPATFLVLAPVASASYPQSPPATDMKVHSPPATAAPLDGPGDKWFVSELTATVMQTTGTAAEPIKSGQEIDESLKPRRSSSVGSDGSAQPRFLKLRPVHFGGEPGETDYC